MAEAQLAQELAPKAQQGMISLPLNMVGGNKFGRYPKISVEQTINMIVSDNALVDYAGYNFVLQFSNNPLAQGRGIFSSTIQDIMIVVIGSAVFSVATNLTFMNIGVLQTSNGEVFITENNAGQILLSDGLHLYLYQPANGFFSTSNISNPPNPDITIDFTPGFISFHNTRFIAAATVGTSSNIWRLSGNNDGYHWLDDSQHSSTLQTKPDTVQAAVPFPGRGNILFLFGHTVIEQWTDQGLALFPYQRSSSFNIDYGCINPSSIAYQGNFIVWVGFSDEAGPVIMYSTGGEIKEISTDGIDFKLSTLKAPQDVSGFLLKIDGHLIYQFTFKTDNLTYLYDFNSGLFYSATDENLNYHIARKIVFFNNHYYFISYNDGNLYQFGTEFTNYTYQNNVIKDIPRIRFTSPVRLPNQRYFVGNSLGFTIEQGQANTNGTNMQVFMSMSRDGGETFDSFVSQNMNATGNRINRLTFHRLGHVNDCCFQFQFWGDSRFVVFDGELQVYV